MHARRAAMETGSPEERDGAERRREAPQQPPPGKLRKTAFKLFGGKRSICTLPSFFGGRGKKGLSKCKTHEGLSSAACDRGGGTGRDSPSGGSRDGQHAALASSRSAQLATDSGTRGELGQQDSSPPGSMEGWDKKPSGEKPSFPRPKKGLKGFFTSIRRHRKSKAAESEKAELPEWSGDAEEPGSAAAGGAQSQGAAEGRAAGPEPEGAASPGGDSSSGQATEPTGPVADGGGSEGDTTAVPGNGDVPDAKAEAEAAACAEFDRQSLLLAFHPDFMDSEPPCLHSGELLSLMLGDVTSLKSFDSLTGCGDDIAEPDIAESSVAVERGRDAAKRSSCLVTYQGGGEEMAIPEENEDYLQQVWDSGVPGDSSYGAQVSSSSLETHASHEADAHPYMDGVDMLTPQSDQQESAPNSDEGYYDSTTPGPDDEAGEELKKDRLPRDSYSGDALYEFDALMSPSHGEESLFEGKVPHQGIFSYFMDFCLPAEKSLIQQMMDQKRGLMETEEEGLAAIQKELLYWELQREPVLKRLDVSSKEKCPREKQCIECKSRAASSIGKGQSGLGSEQVASHTPSRAVNGGVAVARAENPEWRDFPGTLCPENCYNSQKGPGGCLIQLTKNTPGLDAELDCGMFGGPAQAGMFPGFRLPEQEHGAAEPQAGSEPEHAVSFSQALVEFASSGTLFSSLSESLGSSASSSSFTQNLPALPTMVTFDVVDVEQDGEGECEQRPELTAGEDIAEPFDDGYGQKESLAECDERMSPGFSPGFSPGSFQSCNWGVASLPRHLRLHGLSPSLPAPLSVDRRSRSLDTESLELELAEPQAARGGPQPCRLWARREAARKDSAGARRSRSKEEGEHPQRGTHTAPGGVELWVESVWEPAEPADTSPFLPLAVGEAPERRPQEAELSRLPLRPSELPLQPEARRGSCRHPGDVPKLSHPGDVPKLSRLLPLGEAGLPPSFAFASEHRARGKPVGIAQGVPQHPGDSVGDTQSHPEPLKGRATPGHGRGTVCGVTDAE
ncbi:PREDICTED: APC membrane recruitment protein 1 [Ficedula albicollis]|uniref:APC membrane recruitment protein 1 n=1 Tax=Ficedula albicollis TaxID=59894 RepID=UPI0007AD8590|nr:PREDICTED: APC membrane recruitment protein 1 [Ficedula albicollis]